MVTHLFPAKKQNQGEDCMIGAKTEFVRQFANQGCFLFRPQFCAMILGEKGPE